LFFIVGTKPDIDEVENTENELGMLEFIHTLVECMDKWAGSICELDIMYQLEEVHFLVDEMVQNGYIIETNKQNILRPIALMERESQKADSMFR
jgi:AP-4 complex subunit sigma-1